MPLAFNSYASRSEKAVRGYESNSEDENDQDQNMSRDEEQGEEGCCDSCVTGIQRCLKPISPWIPAIKNIGASGADVVTDWLFYLRIANDTTGTLEKFVWPLFAFSVLSTVFLVIVIYAELSERCFPGCANKCLKSRIFCCCCKCMKTMKFIQMLEIIFEDIPQILLSNWVRQEQAGWNTAAIVNIITSAYNIAFDLMSVLELTPQEEERLAKRT